MLSTKVSIITLTLFSLIEGVFPTYRVVVDSEVDGADERFTVEVRLRDRPLARGIGRTKRAAERLAAADALAGWPPDSTKDG